MYCFIYVYEPQHNGGFGIKFNYVMILAPQLKLPP